MTKDELKSYILRDAENMRSLSFSENYIKEAILNTQKWGTTGLLGGLSDPFVGRQVARLMENQRELNEEGKDSYAIPANAETNWNPAQWRRVSIPAIRRVFGAFLPYNLVSVQAISKPEDRFHYTGLDERQNSLLIQSRTRSVGREWWNPNTLSEDGQHSLELEAEETARFAQRYANDVTREVIRDLSNNAGSKANAEYTNPDALATLIEGMSAYIGAKIKGRDATWIVASPTVTNLLKPFVNEWKEDADGEGEDFRLSEKYRGKVKDRWELYESPLQPDGKVLMGFKDSRNHYFSGYFLCPYLPFTQQPGWWKEDGTHQHTVLYSRYGKKLIEANFYGLIELANLPTPQTEEAPAAAEETKGESEA
jgi:hypothetical protein